MSVVVTLVIVFITVTGLLKKVPVFRLFVTVYSKVSGYLFVSLQQ